MKDETREHAAWRAFGLLTPEEQEAFDAAVGVDAPLAEARGRVEALAAAVSVTHSRPVAPGADVWDHIGERCGIARQRRTFISSARLRSVLSWAGWGVAAALAVLLAVRDRTDSLTAGRSQGPETPAPSDNPRRVISHSPANPPAPDKTFTESPVRQRSLRPPADPPAAGPPEHDALATTNPPPPQPVVPPGNTPPEPTAEHGEKRRLIQEIATLRAELTQSQAKNREMLLPAPGRSWPLIVEMKSPSAVRDESSPPLSSQIADAFANKPAPEPKTPSEATPQLQATAIPVYDPARDTGTLAVRNLPVATGFRYNLWVSTADSSEPVYVGTLPANLRSTDSLDFSLGSTGIIPTTYYLTTGTFSAGNTSQLTETSINRDQLIAPNSSNIVLQGP
ncbi:MAG TPA: hypothetical protein VHM91_01270 [Verrucomicrobiales bacterium]|jgi:hypothetical protein|nr:hypothetical protein [Verrucomicrobiales bacterium]